MCDVEEERRAFTAQITILMAGSPVPWVADADADAAVLLPTPSSSPASS